MSLLQISSLELLERLAVALAGLILNVCLSRRLQPGCLMQLGCCSKYEASLFIYVPTSIVVKTAELLMLKCNLNIGPSALIIAERIIK